VVKSDVLKYKSEEDTWENIYVFANYTASNFRVSPTLQIEEEFSSNAVA